jgi:glycosyltransferase involved in cell wall biosynthesis
MRVGLLSHNAQFGDAIGNQLVEKAGFFLERGAEVRLFVESEQRLHPALRSLCQRLAPVTTGPGWQFLSTADLIIVEYSQTCSLLTLLPLLAGRKPRILFNYHGVTPAEFYTGANREVLEQGLQQRGWVWSADLALVHSRFMARELHEATGFPVERIGVLPHPVDCARFCPGLPARDLRHTAFPSGRSRILLFVGRLAPNKCLHTLVEALARLRDEVPVIHALVAGDTGDVYELEMERCRRLALDLGVAEQLHFLGRVSEGELLDAYRSADVFVMPSCHEGFCIPVIEAMACGVPVVAARTTALPETIGSAGLTFRAEDARDLERQLRRVLAVPGPPPAASQLRPKLRVALVAFRYGSDFAGGAEQSLRSIAAALARGGHAVEVFTTCTRSENHWANDLPEGTVPIDGVPVHRFHLDPHDRGRHLDSVRAVLKADGPVSDAVERDYVRHSIHSTRLIESLAQRIDEFDAVITGPYLYGVTWDLAWAFPEKTLLLPCFHDEPLARLRLWLDAYGGVGGILYHSPEEKQWAEGTLGLNHPGGVYIGTCLDPGPKGDPQRRQAAVSSGRRYLVYCGRYSAQKNLPLLLDHARRYAELHPERFTFVFLGEGEVAIAKAEWARDLGFVDAGTRNDILAGAEALLQLSQNESLSLVALEAWSQGTPVVIHQDCAVLAGHLRRCGGGWAIDSFDGFATTLDALWEHPEDGRARGRRAQAYVVQHYANPERFLQLLTEAIHELRLPLAERLRRRGLERAGELHRAAWRERFSGLVEEVMEAPPRTGHPRLEIRPRSLVCVAAVGQDQALVTVRLANRGTGPAVPEGPARQVLRAATLDEAGQTCSLAPLETPLPAMILPGQETPAVMAVAVPRQPGNYRVALSAGPVEATNLKGQMTESESYPTVPDAWLQLKVTEEAASARSMPAGASTCCAPGLDAVHKALVQAARLQQLPDDYLDVTEGWFTNWKRRIKRKLLGNFKYAYVDVLSRQQSRFNRQVLEALHELMESFAALDHRQALSEEKRKEIPEAKRESEFLTAAIERSVAEGQAEELALLLRGLFQQVADNRRTIATLEERLVRLEHARRRTSS